MVNGQKVTNLLGQKITTYITNLVCYTYFHWFLNPECQHIFGKQTGYIFQPFIIFNFMSSPVKIIHQSLISFCYSMGYYWIFFYPRQNFIWDQFFSDSKYHMTPVLKIVPTKNLFVVGPLGLSRQNS
jgi:hypothetical protein